MSIVYVYVYIRFAASIHRPRISTDRYQMNHFHIIRSRMHFKTHHMFQFIISTLEVYYGDSTIFPGFIIVIFPKIKFVLFLTYILVAKNSLQGQVTYRVL